MARYVDISGYEDCRIVRNKEDEGFPVKDLPTAKCREIINGEWVMATSKEAGILFGLVECSRCLTRIPEHYSTVVSWCPQCGAYMNSHNLETEETK